MDKMIHLKVSSTKIPPAIQQVLEWQTEESYPQTLLYFYTLVWANGTFVRQKMQIWLFGLTQCTFQYFPAHSVVLIYVLKQVSEKLNHIWTVSPGRLYFHQLRSQFYKLSELRETMDQVNWCNSVGCHS